MRTLAIVASVTIWAVSFTNASRMSSSSLMASSSALRSPSNGASEVGNEPVMTAMTVSPSRWTITRPSFSSSAIASNEPSRISRTWIAVSPLWAATCSQSFSMSTVSFVRYEPRNAALPAVSVLLRYAFTLCADFMCILLSVD